MELPPLYVVDQNFEAVERAKTELYVARELERTNLLGSVVAGQTVIITAGSRGVDSMAMVLRSLAEAVKARGSKTCHPAGYGKPWRGHSPRAGGGS